MLVPEIRDQPPGIDERMFTPGATTSGFRRSEIGVGPTEEKSARMLTGGTPIASTAPTVIAADEVPGEDTEPAPTSR
jgi:hypothetical protein